MVGVLILLGATPSFAWIGHLNAYEDVGWTAVHLDAFGAGAMAIEPALLRLPCRTLPARERREARGPQEGARV